MVMSGGALGTLLASAVSMDGLSWTDCLQEELTCVEEKVILLHTISEAEELFELFQQGKPLVLALVVLLEKLEASFADGRNSICEYHFLIFQRLNCGQQEICREPRF